MLIIINDETRLTCFIVVELGSCAGTGGRKNRGATVTVGCLGLFSGYRFPESCRGDYIMSSPVIVAVK